MVGLAEQFFVTVRIRNPQSIDRSLRQGQSRHDDRYYYLVKFDRGFSAA